MPTTSYVYKAVGGADIVNLYKAIGAAAEQQAQKIERSNRRAAASTREASTGLKALSGAMGEIRMAAEPFVAQLGPLSRGLTALSGAGIAGAATAGVLGLGAALLVGAKRAADYADALLEQARAIGISVTKFQELRFAAATFGVDQERLAVALSKFTKSVGEAEQGSGALVKQLKDSDPALLRLLQSTASVDVKFEAFTKKLQGAESASQRMVLGAAAMGRGFAPLATMFAESADALQALIDRAHSTGAVIDEELIRKGAAASDAWDVFALSVKGVAAGALLELTGYLKASYDEAAKLLALIERARGMAPSAAILPDVRAGLTEGPGGGITAKIAVLEQRLDEARKLQASGFEGIPSIVGGPSVTETIDDLTRKLGQLNDTRADYVTQTRGVVAAEGEAAKKARETTQALDDYGKIIEKLKPDLAAINALEKERLATIATARKTGAVDPAEAARAEAQVRKEAQESRDQLNAKAVAAEKAAADSRKRVLEEVRRMEDAAALAPLEGIARVDTERDQALERFKERLKEQEITEEDYNKFAVAITATAEAEKAEIRKKEADKLAKEQESAAKEAERLAKDAAKESERVAKEAAQPFLDAAQSISQDLTSALVDAFFAGEGQARDSADVIKDIFRGLAEDLLRMFAEKAILGPLAASVQGLAAGGTTGADATGGLGKIASLLGGLVGGGGRAGGAITAGQGIMELPAGVQGPVMTEAAAASLNEAGPGLATSATALLTAAVALYGAGTSLAASRDKFSEATLGTAQAAGNRLTAAQAGIVATSTIAGAIGGVAIGTAAFPGIGTLVGAAVGTAVGAAIGTAISEALGNAVVAGVKGGVAEGLDQSGLQKKIAKELSGDILVMLATGGTTAIGAGSVLAKWFAPNIEEIFGKMFRDVLGAEGGGLSTTNVAVGSGGMFGLKALSQDAQRAARIIAESIGAGGAAFPGNRAGQFRTILLGGIRARMDATGEEASQVLADAFVGAFTGHFFRALKNAAKTGLDRQQQDFNFVATQFARGAPSFGLNFRAIADAVGDEGNVPLMKARRASQEAVKQGLQDALADAADASAFRKSLTNSVTEAFVSAVSSALLKGPLGEAFAPFFSVSNVQPAALKRAQARGDEVEVAEIEARGLRNRRELRKARREGDTGAELDILKREFLADVKNFAQVVSDPAFLTALKELTDATLVLQVAASLASGDITAAADAIEAQLLPSIKILEEMSALTIEIGARVAKAQEKPGSEGAARAEIAELRAARIRAEEDFKRRSGGNTIEDVRRLVEDRKGPADVQQAIGLNELLKDPARLSALLQEYATARLAELEAELAMVRAMADQLESAQRTVRAFQERIEKARGIEPKETAVEKARRLGAVATFGQFLDPDSVNAFFDAMSDAIAEAEQSLQQMEAAAKAFGQIARSIAQSLDPSGATTRKQLAQRMQDVNLLVAKVPKSIGTDEAAEVAADLQEAIQEAAGLATAQRDFFKAAREGFENLAKSVRDFLDPEGRLKRVQAEITKLTPAGRTGDQEALTNLQSLIGQAIGIAGQRRDAARAAAEGFGDIGEQAAVIRGGRRAQRGQLAARRDELAALLPRALGGDLEALQKAQRLATETLSLGQATLRGGRLRGLAGDIQSIVGQLERASEGQVGVAEAQLVALEKLATSLGFTSGTFEDAATKQLVQLQAIAASLEIAYGGAQSVAQQSLDELQDIADDAEGFINTKLPTVLGTLGDIKTAFTTFRDKMKPVIDYLSATAGVTIAAQLSGIAGLLIRANFTAEGNIAALLDVVKTRLPAAAAFGAAAQAGQPFLVGERGPEFFVPRVAGTILPSGVAPPQTTGSGTVVTVNLALTIAPPANMTRAQADEFGRSLVGPLERAAERAVRRALPRKVA